MDKRIRQHQLKQQKTKATPTPTYRDNVARALKRVLRESLQMDCFEQQILAHRDN